MADAAKNEDRLKQQIAVTNFELLNRKQQLVNLDPLKDMNVFERLQYRTAKLLEKVRQRKNDLWKERKKNMELVLATVRLLVLPEDENGREATEEAEYRWFPTEISPTSHTETSRSDVGMCMCVYVLFVSFLCPCDRCVMGSFVLYSSSTTDQT